MEIYEVQSLDDLKSLGSHKNIATIIKKEIGQDVKIKTRSWKDLFNTICENRQLLSEIQKNKEKAVQENHAESKYFISKEAEILFYLIELSGEIRLKKLGINKKHFTDKNKATKWRNDLLKIIHPDKCHHPKASIGASKLNSIYFEMVKDE